MKQAAHRSKSIVGSLRKIQTRSQIWLAPTTETAYNLSALETQTSSSAQALLVAVGLPDSVLPVTLASPSEVNLTSNSSRNSLNESPAFKQNKTTEELKEQTSNTSVARSDGVMSDRTEGRFMQPYVDSSSVIVHDSLDQVSALRYLGGEHGIDPDVMSEPLRGIEGNQDISREVWTLNVSSSGVTFLRWSKVRP